jgi:hypothetical protein
VTAQAINSVLMRRPLVQSTHMAFVPILLLAILAGLIIPAPYRATHAILAALGVLVVYLIVALIAASMGVLLPVFSAVMVILIAWLLSMLFKVAFPV